MCLIFQGTMRFILLTSFVIQTVNCARILGIFYFPMYSHFTLGETIFKELAAKGHELTVISAYPQKEKLKNYEDVNLTLVKDFVDTMLQPENVMQFIGRKATDIIPMLYELGSTVTDLTLLDKNVQELLHSNETFDLIILEQFLNEAHFGFMHRFNAPLILITTVVPSFWSNNLMTNPTHYSFLPNLNVHFSPNMNLWQRAWNAFISIFESVYFHTYALPQQDKILHKYFPDAPPITNLINNASLLLLNSNPATGSPVPLLPNMIEIGGFHIQKKQQKELSKDLKFFLDEAKEGVIYFALGSNIQSKNLDKQKLQHILKTFAKLKMKVLWKWESDTLPGKPSNVRIEKWLPQTAILAHGNVKLFITQGGKLSINEAIYYGKPILGIPMFSEQCFNIQEAVHLGYGRYISYQTLTENELTEVLTDMIENPRYAEEAKYRSNAIRSLKVSPLDNAINWIEYVIEAKGAPHLKNKAANLPWYQYILLDVILIISITIWVVTKISWTIFLKLSARFNAKKQKIN